MGQVSDNPSIVFLTTYPPRRCGIATFSQDLIKALNEITIGELRIKVAALQDPLVPVKTYPQEVNWVISQDNIKDYKNLALDIRDLDDVFAVVIQHEYGIFGGDFGDYLIEFMRNVQKPIITTLHTVLPRPQGRFKEITQEIIDFSKVLIVMSEDSKKIILQNYENLLDDKVCVIPHGIHPVVFQDSLLVKTRLGFAGRTLVLTFGLLSRNKGIEYVLEALPEVVSLYPNLLYLVVGATHPVVKQKEGESYRKFLQDTVRRLHLENNVLFINRYLALKDLLSYIQASDICISCNLNPDQSVSGTLSYALGSGRAVIATKFRQAKQIVTPEVGKLVPPQDSAAIQEALFNLLKDPQKLPELHWNAYKKTRNMLWTNVADEYLHLIYRFKLYPKPFFPPLNLKYLEKMRGKLGLIQFAELSTPNLESGYTTDDNARALICYLNLYKLGFIDKDELERKVRFFLRFIELGKQPNGRFINYLAGSNPSVTGKNEEEDLEDTLGRVIWALSEFLANPFLENGEIRLDAEKLLASAISNLKFLTHLRASAFSLYGLCLFGGKRFKKEARFLANRLKHSFLKKIDSSDNWHWFEDRLSYSNGILPAALLRYGRFLNDEKSIEIGLKALRFLCNISFLGDVFVPIGQGGWFEKGKERAFFDQQPEEVYHMILALYEAWKVTFNHKYKRLLHKCFSWFMGNNLIGKPLYNPVTGGCYDGLTPLGVNMNQGSESLLSYLMSRLIVEKVYL